MHTAKTDCDAGAAVQAGRQAGEQAGRRVGRIARYYVKRRTRVICGKSCRRDRWQDANGRCSRRVWGPWRVVAVYDEKSVAVAAYERRIEVEPITPGHELALFYRGQIV